ncbi:MAG: DUF4915 domain-containing protein [Acidimicrobiia bacterium]
MVGLSKERDQRAFSGLELDEHLRDTDDEARCGIYVIDSRSGIVLHTLELEGAVTEFYDVQVIPDVACPTTLGFEFDDIHLTITIDTDDGPVFQRPEEADVPRLETELADRRRQGGRGSAAGSLSQVQLTSRKERSTICSASIAARTEGSHSTSTSKVRSTP